MFLFKLNTTQFSREIEEIIRVTGKTAGQVIKEEGKLFVKDVIAMTPPFGTAPSTESLNAQRKVGEKAVERDIRRVFHELDLSKIRNEKVREDLKRLARKDDLESIKRVLKNCRIPVREVIREAVPKMHEEARDRRGRVQRNQWIWVLKGRTVTRYIREKKRHVGLAKSGWLKAARALGVKVTNWITRHNGAGEFVDRTRDPRQPSIRVGNTVEFIQPAGAALQIVKRALQNRVRNMRAKLERIARSGWKRRH